MRDLLILMILSRPLVHCSLDLFLRDGVFQDGYSGFFLGLLAWNELNRTRFCGGRWRQRDAHFGHDGDGSSPEECCCIKSRGRRVLLPVGTNPQKMKSLSKYQYLSDTASRQLASKKLIEKRLPCRFRLDSVSEKRKKPAVNKLCVIVQLKN